MSNIYSSAKKKTLYLFLILGLALLLRVICLDKSFSGDEMNSVLGAKQDINNILVYVAENDSYPPMQHLLLHFWLKIADSEAWTRILYVIFGVGVCLIAYLLGSEYIDRRFGLCVLFFASLSPQLIQLSQYARGIIISTFFATLSVYFLIKIAKQEDRFLYWAAYVFSSICALYSFYFSALILIAQNLYVIFNYRRMKSILWKWLAAQLLIAVSLVVWLSLFIRQLSAANIANNAVACLRKGFFVFGFHAGSFVRGIFGTFGLDQLFFSNIAFSEKYPAWVLILITTLSIFVLLVIILRSGSFFREENAFFKISPYFFQFLIIVPIILAMVLRQALNFPVMSRYFAPLSVFFIIVLLGAILSLRNKKSVSTLLVLLTALFVMRIPGVYSPIEQWREAVSYIEKKADSGDCVMFLEKGKSDYSYYSKLENPRLVIAEYFIRDAKTADLIGINKSNSKKLSKLLRPYGRIWVVLTHTKISGGEDVLKNWLLSNGFKKRVEEKFAGIEVLLYENRI